MTDAALLVTTVETRAGAGEPITAAEANALLTSADLLTVGRLGETARRHVSGEHVTFCRVLLAAGPGWPASLGAAGEVRIPSGTEPAGSIDVMAEQTAAARSAAGERLLTGFSVTDVLAACNGRSDGVADAAARLRAAGLEAIAECPVDAFESNELAIDVVRALTRGGLGVWRLTVGEAPIERRLALIERAGLIQQATGQVRAFAPLPRRDPATEPATGYDDVRTVAVARLMCPTIRHIQVDWPLYGPKLAQVAVLYGANDIDGVSPADDPALGTRRAPLEEIRRQIRAAAAVPVERNGRYEVIP